jgi:hypothetical protein
VRDTILGGWRGVCFIWAVSGLAGLLVTICRRAFTRSTTVSVAAAVAAHCFWGSHSIRHTPSRRPFEPFANRTSVTASPRHHHHQPLAARQTPPLLPPAAARGRSARTRPGSRPAPPWSPPCSRHWPRTPPTRPRPRSWRACCGVMCGVGCPTAVRSSGPVQPEPSRCCTQRASNPAEGTHLSLHHAGAGGGGGAKMTRCTTLGTSAFTANLATWILVWAGHIYIYIMSEWVLCTGPGCGAAPRASLTTWWR